MDPREEYANWKAPERGENGGEKGLAAEKSKVIETESLPDGKKFKRGDGTEVSVLYDEKSNAVLINVTEKGKQLPERKVPLSILSEKRPTISENKSGGIRIQKLDTYVEVTIKNDGGIFISDKDRYNPNLGLSGSTY